jgi:hypothetical protein
MRRMRAAPIVIVALGTLTGPSSAWAHSRRPPVALDYRLELASPTPLSGVRADVIGGDRALRLDVAPPTRLVVLGILGEPFLRFAADGVWVDSHSPTAATDGLVRGVGAGWTRLTRGHSLAWHDHRLAPPSGLRVGTQAPWSLPVTVGGRRASIAGSFVRVPRPQLWPWLGGGVLGLAAIVVLVRRLAGRRVELAAVLAVIAAPAALAASAGFTTGDPLSGGQAWVELTAAAVLTAVACGALLIRDRSVRLWIAMLTGIVAALVCLSSLSVFWHGVILSTLPGGLVRLLVAVAVISGSAAAVLGIAVDAERPTVPARATAAHR